MIATTDEVVVDVPRNTLAISEVFGPTIQGEGPSAGRAAIFVRLAGCNLACSWCDTPYTWDWTGQNGAKYDPTKEVRMETIEDIATTVSGLVRPRHRPIIVITGGEPMLQYEKVCKLITAISSDLPYKPEFEVETNGTIPPHIAPWVTRFNVSPKLENSGRHRGRMRMNANALMAYAALPTDKACFKFVIEDPHRDLIEVDMLVDGLAIDKRQVWIMPKGRTHDQVSSGMRHLAQYAIPKGYNISPRLHVSIWGDERGR